MKKANSPIFGAFSFNRCMKQFLFVMPITFLLGIRIAHADGDSCPVEFTATAELTKDYFQALLIQSDFQVLHVIACTKKGLNDGITLKSPQGTLEKCTVSTDAQPSSGTCHLVPLRQIKDRQGILWGFDVIASTPSKNADRVLLNPKTGEWAWMLWDDRTVQMYPTPLARWATHSTHSQWLVPQQKVPFYKEPRTSSEHLLDCDATIKDDEESPLALLEKPAGEWVKAVCQASTCAYENRRGECESQNPPSDCLPPCPEGYVQWMKDGRLFIEPPTSEVQEHSYD